MWYLSRNHSVSHSHLFDETPQSHWPLCTLDNLSVYHILVDCPIFNSEIQKHNLQFNTLETLEDNEHGQK